MSKGAIGTYLVRNLHLNVFLQHLDQVLWEAGFEARERQWFGPVMRGRSMWGSSGRAVLVSGFIPFGSLIKEGNRYGAEFEAYQTGPHVFLRLLIAPYMAIFDHRDVFLLSQGILEMYTDDKYCLEFLMDLENRIKYKGLWMEPYQGQR
jgi:hypothetical protein